MGASLCGANLEIPPCFFLASNRARLSRVGTLRGGQFDWGGRLPNCNGGVQRFPQSVWQSLVEYKGIRELNCETDKSSRCESRT